MCVRSWGPDMRPEEDTLKLPPFVPLFVGIREHARAGMSPAEFGACCMLHLVCDYGSGVWQGTAETLSHCFGGKEYTKAIRENMHKLRAKGLIWYPVGTGKRAAFPILINKYLVRKGPLKGYVLNAFAFEKLDRFCYDWPGGGRADTGLTSDGGKTVSRLMVGGRWTDARPIQEYKSFKRVIVCKKSKRKRVAMEALTDDDRAQLTEIADADLDTLNLFTLDDSYTSFDADAPAPDGPAEDDHDHDPDYADRDHSDEDESDNDQEESTDTMRDLTQSQIAPRAGLEDLPDARIT
jgi:hypothetical protein